jgi:hypothetical protein
MSLILLGISYPIQTCGETAATSSSPDEVSCPGETVIGVLTASKVLSSVANEKDGITALNEEIPCGCNTVVLSSIAFAELIAVSSTGTNNVDKTALKPPTRVSAGDENTLAIRPSSTLF